MLYSTFRGNEATCYGMEIEETTIQEYTASQQRDIPARLDNRQIWTDRCLENSWLAASPDSTVKDPNDASQPLGLVGIRKPSLYMVHNFE